MKKTILIGITLSIFIVFLPLKVFGYTFYDDFEAYEYGDLSPQSEWNKDAGHEDFTVTNVQEYQGDKSINCGGIPAAGCMVTRFFSTTTAGILSAWVYKGSGVDSPCEMLRFIPAEDTDTAAGEFRIGLVGGICKASGIIAGGQIDLGNFIYDIWHEISFQWNYDIQKVKYKFENNDWTNWFDPPYPFEPINNLQILRQNDKSNDYIDDIYPDEAPFITSFDETEFFISYPTDCRFNVVSYTTTTIDFYSVGHFTNPPASTITYDDLNINFYNSSGEATSSHIEGISYPNSDLGWSNEISLPKDNYRIEYTAEGYDENGSYRIYTHYCSGSGVGYEMPTGPIDWWGTKFDTCAGIYDQCIASSTNFLEEVVCDIMGFGLSIVCPSPVVLKRSWAILDDVKTRFPLSYISLVRTTFSSDLSATNLAATSSATTSMVGVDLSGYEQLGQLTWISNLKMIFGYGFIFSTLLYVIIFSSKNFFN